MESDQVAATAMVRAEDKLLRRQLRESALDVARAQARAIPPDRHNLLIAELRDLFDGVFKAGRETSPGLPVNAGTSGARASCRREQMNINRARNFRVKGGAEKWPRCIRQRTPRQIDMQVVGEYEDGSTGHAFWIREREGERQAFFVEPFALRTAGLSRFGKLTYPVKISGPKLQSEFEARKGEHNTPRIHNLVTRELRFLEKPVGFLLDSFRRGVSNTIIRVYANGILILNFSFLEAFAECGGPFKDAHFLGSNENGTDCQAVT
jgi:hypothetical protein